MTEFERRLRAENKELRKEIEKVNLEKAEMIHLLRSVEAKAAAHLAAIKLEQLKRDYPEEEGAKP